jgi:uncharacterized protein DUF4129
MNSLTTSVMKRVRPLAQDRPTFNWIEILAVPITTSIMETPPIALLLLFGSVLFTGKSEASPLEAGSIFLLLLGLYWWAMLVKQVMQHNLSKRRAIILHLLGLCVALAVTVGTHRSLIENMPALIIAGALIIWFWQRGMSRVQAGLNEEQLITSFKAGFFALLAMLLLAATDVASTKGLLAVLAYALPLFFLSGLITLSFTRLGSINREYRHRRSSPGGSQADPTRGWLILLLLLWGAIVALLVILGLFTFQPLQMLLSPLWSALGTLFGWIVFLFDLLIHKPQKLPPHGHRIEPPPRHPLPPQPYSNPFLAVMLLILVLVVLLLVILVVLRQWYIIRNSASEDEIREGLSVRSILRARREKRQKRSKVMLEPLDPTSARARYRELLQTMARQGNELGRRLNETPTEYQTRLLTLFKKTSAEETQKDGTPSDAAILDELTRAYALERYGGKHTDQSQQAYLRRWVSHLVKRLKVNASKRTH